MHSHLLIFGKYSQMFYNSDALLRLEMIIEDFLWALESQFSYTFTSLTGGQCGGRCGVCTSYLSVDICTCLQEPSQTLRVSPERCNVGGRLCKAGGHRVHTAAHLNQAHHTLQLCKDIAKVGSRSPSYKARLNNAGSFVCWCAQRWTTPVHLNSEQQQLE